MSPTTRGRHEDILDATKRLDLVRVGARFDTCDTVTLDEMEDLSLTEVLLRALRD